MTKSQSTTQTSELINKIKDIVKEHTYPGTEFFTVDGISDEMAEQIIKVVVNDVSVMEPCTHWCGDERCVYGCIGISPNALKGF
jgi:hypothetical protein